MGYELGGIEALYEKLQPRLVRIVASNLRAPDWLIDEACQSAWSSLLTRRETIAAGGELGWLVTTATREALRQLRLERSAEPIGSLTEPVRLDDHRRAVPGPESSFEARERLGEIRRLPVRQQRMLLLHGFGYEYGEIAAAMGESRRAVARQLTLARRDLGRGLRGA